jgi:hypothetical protein
MMDNVGIYNAMMDFSNEKGDQEMISVFKAWLNNNMGGNWVVEPASVSIKMARLEAIVEISEMVADLVAKQGRQESEILSEIMRLLVIKFKEVKWDITPSPKQ